MTYDEQVAEVEAEIDRWVEAELERSPELGGGVLAAVRRRLRFPPRWSVGIGEQQLRK